MPTILGTSGADSLTGGSGDDSIAGLDGPDTVNGLAGNDTLDGGSGDDSLNDSSGGDLLLGGTGNDYIVADHRSGNTGALVSLSIDGGDGDDVVLVYQKSPSAVGPQDTLSASILGGAGDDYVRLTGDFAATVNGGAGDDNIGVTGLFLQSVQLTLGPGEDVVVYDPKAGWSGLVTITDFQAGNGGDRLLAPIDFFSNWDGAANPFSDGHLRLVQQGADTVLQIDRDGPGGSLAFQDFVRFQNTSAGAFTAFNLLDFAPSNANAGPETLTGTAGADLLNGAPGADSLQGAAGADTLFGDAGDDTIDGGLGADTLDGGPGKDSISGGAGDDVIRVITGADTVSGGDGADLIDARTSLANNVLFGDAGDDTLHGSIGGDTLSGGAGNDLLIGLSVCSFDGGDGNDTVIAWIGPDQIATGSGSDTIVITSQTSTVPYGMDAVTDWTAQDKLVFQTSNTPAFGAAVGGLLTTENAADFNTALSRASAAAHTQNATFVAVQVGPDVILFADLLHIGNVQEAVILRGATLADVTAANIQGATPAAAGPAVPTTTAGDDNLSATPTTPEIHAGAGNDTIAGAGAPDYLRGDDGNDVIIGGPAFDDINGNMGNDTAHGNAGDDWVVGGKDGDQLYGDAGNDIVWGNLGNDTLDGGDGDDQVRGGQGDDEVNGGAGNDFVSGDRGNDTITGGAGADLFHGSQDAGIDRVLDFKLSEGDRVMLDPGTTYTVTQVGADTVIDMGGGNQMLLVGVQMSTLPPGTIFLG